eukprot:2123062-Rhodomonas_salina.2
MRPWSAPRAGRPASAGQGYAGYGGYGGYGGGGGVGGGGAVGKKLGKKTPWWNKQYSASCEYPRCCAIYFVRECLGLICLNTPIPPCLGCEPVCHASSPSALWIGRFRSVPHEVV